MSDPYQAPSRFSPESHKRKADKLKRIPIKVEVTETPLKKPDWIRIRLGSNDSVNRIKRILRERQLHTVCEEAACPNLSECFGHGTATFMILGDVCTRRCPFCDVAHGKPLPPDMDEPQNLAETIAELGLRYVVITSVDRDDLRDGGAAHFLSCIKAIREKTPETKIEVLVPDFRGRTEVALDILGQQVPDVFNHNLETVPRLYKAIRPGADYQVSLDLLAQFKKANPAVLTKSGIMLGLGETIDEVKEVMADLRKHGCDMLTLGQYLQPSREHLPVIRFIEPDEFKHLADVAGELGFSSVASAPMVRSSYHADQQVIDLLADHDS